MAYRATARVRKVEGAGAALPREQRGRRPEPPVIADTMLKMRIGDCYDINRRRGAIEEIARRLRRQYDMERKWTVRQTEQPHWSRVWRVL